MVTREDHQFYRQREAQCLEAADKATDRSARQAQLKLAEFYRRRALPEEEASTPKGSRENAG